METLDVEPHRSRRFEHSFSLLRRDIDRFNPLNARYGRGCGDDGRRTVAERIQTNSALTPVTDEQRTAAVTSEHRPRGAPTEAQTGFGETRSSACIKKRPN